MTTTKPSHPFEPGDMVITPSGSHAELVAIYEDIGEVLVQWSSGDRARFKIGLVKPVPRPEK